jgi:hypothetical protein
VPLGRLIVSLFSCFLQAAKKTADKSKTILNNIERWQKVCDLNLVIWCNFNFWSTMLILLLSDY